MNNYGEIKPLIEPNIYTAIYDFVLTSLNLPPNNIIRGWQNRVSLPANTNEYAVISLIRTERQGTNVNRMNLSTPNGEQQIYELIKASMQIDTLSDDANVARGRASTLEMLSRSSFAVNFLSEYGITPLYADQPIDLTGIDGSEQFVPRFSTTLYLSYWAELKIELPFFTDVTLHLEEVDTFHPEPKGR